MLSVVCKVTKILSWTTLSRLGAALGWVWYYLVPVRRRTVLEGLALAFPNLDPRRRREIARAAFRHFAVGALEILRLGASSPEEIASWVETRGLEHYRRAAAAGRGVVVVTGHYGNFDVLACSQAAAGVPLAIVSRTLGRGAGNRFWMRARARTGLHIIEEGKSPRRVVAWLRSGGALGLTVDQRTGPSRGGIPASFLGRPAWTSTAAARLALRTGAPVLPVRIERDGPGRHSVVVEPEIASAGCDVETLTQRVNDVLGGWVARRPEQWMWLHRRFAVPKEVKRAGHRGGASAPSR